MLTGSQISTLRAQFPILQQTTYLYNCSQGALSTAVEGGLLEFARTWRTGTAPWDEWVGSYEALRAEFARFINADPDEVAIVTSASAGINPIANAVQFGKRNRVVMGEYEFPTMGHIWLAQQSRGAQAHFIDGVDHAISVDAYADAIDDRTCIVPLTQVSFVNGFRADVAAITRIAHERGALVFLDGFQDCGTRPVDVKALDVDFFVTGALKYLLGPPGVAFLYVKRDHIETLKPTVTGWMAQRDIFAYDPKVFDPAPTARRFECGTPSIPNVFMARPGLRLLTETGMENVAEQITSLTRRFAIGVRELGIASKTPNADAGPLVVLQARDAGAVVAAMAARNIAISSRHDGVRFAFHVYNNADDVDITLQALKDNLGLMVRA